jgi:guanylate kinase
MNTLIILSGVSGSGKTTVMKYLLDTYPNLEYIPSYTTRDPRPGEKDGERYHFISQSQFEDAVKKNAFLEYAQVHQKHYYGTKTEEINNVLKKGKIPVKEMETQGIQQVLETLKNKNKNQITPISIFLDIDSETMKHRITSRAPISHEELERRIQTSTQERIQAEKICTHILDATPDIDTVVEKVSNTLKPYIMNKLPI